MDHASYSKLTGQVRKLLSYHRSAVVKVTLGSTDPELGSFQTCKKRQQSAPQGEGLYRIPSTAFREPSVTDTFA